MEYIVLDMEWNTHPAESGPIREPFPFDSEIVEIGAVKLNEKFQPIDEFKILICPVFYPQMRGYLQKLTHIGQSMLENAAGFPEAYQAFRSWCGEDCGFCTWGPDDIPVLLDNLLMHHMPTENIPVCFDLQRIFGHEVMMDDRQHSLDEAVRMLNETADRAHDALHDARNTVRVCMHMDPELYLDEYALTYAGYAAERLSGRTEGKLFRNPDEADADTELNTLTCPYCGGECESGERVTVKSGALIRSAECPEGDVFLLKYRRKWIRGGGLRLSRTVLGMNDDWWEIYQNALDDAAERRDGHIPE